MGDRSAGALLFFAVLLSLGLANSPWGEFYLSVWQLPLVGHSLLFWINHGLMVIFFFQIGLELKREMVKGELSSPRQAAIPILAATGGMLVPALIFVLLNRRPEWNSGWAIPMATDVAFSLGVLSFMKLKVKRALRGFLVTLAVVDDLGAVVVIALFYGSAIVPWLLVVAAALLIVLWWLRSSSVWLYTIGAVAVWLCFLTSGVDPTIAGVLSAFVIPQARVGARLEHALRPWVAFAILPLFALANAAVAVPPAVLAVFSEPLAIAIGLALLLGKPIGVFLATWGSVRAGIGRLPQGAGWRMLFGVACLCGIGFTMSLFLTTLAFHNAEVLNIAKMAVLGASLLAGLLGFMVLLNVG